MAAGVAMVLILLAAIGLVIAGGDRIGIRILEAAPRAETNSRSQIVVSFEENIDPASVRDSLRLDPPVYGDTRASGNKLVFSAHSGFQAGLTYRVTVEPNIRAATGRRLLNPYSWQFRTRPLRVAYLAPVDNIIQNVYLVDPQNPASPRQLTFSEKGVVGLDVSADGSRIIYAELGENVTVSLFQIDIESGAVGKLVDCPGAQCANPAWSPNGEFLAFERVELNLDSNIAPGAPRIWLSTTASGEVRPLYNDSQRVGYMPRWAGDSERIATFDANIGGIVVTNLVDGSEQVIRTPQGEVGHFSPDGRWMFYPRILQVPGDTRYVAHFVLVDLRSGNLASRDLTPDTEANNDIEMSWMPDSRHAVLVRRVPPPEGANTIGGAQLYLIDTETAQAEALTDDPTYSAGMISVSPGGEVVLFQRFALGTPGARPGIWTLDLATRTPSLIAENATQPRWVP